MSHFNHNPPQPRILAQFSSGVSVDFMYCRKPAFSGVIMSDGYLSGTVNPFGFSMPCIENGLRLWDYWLDAYQSYANSVVGTVPARTENASNIFPIKAGADFPQGVGAVTKPADAGEIMSQGTHYGLTFFAAASGITSGMAARVFSESYKPLSLFLPLPKKPIKSRILGHSGHCGVVAYCDFK